LKRRGNTKKYQSAFFTFVHKKSQDCYRFKNGCSLLFISFLLLFIYFFSCVYTGYYSDPVACGAKS
jgi:hypothetical protein